MFNYKRTQTTRPHGAMSAPMRDLMYGSFGLEHLIKDLEILHFGEGKDWWTTFALRDAGAKAYAYDPYSPYETVRSNAYLNMDWDIVISSYVYNVIPPLQRMEIFKDNQRMCAMQIWAVRADTVTGTPYEDGVLTKAGTFQKSYKSTADIFSEWPDANIIEHKPGSYWIMSQLGWLYPRNFAISERFA